MSDRCVLSGVWAQRLQHATTARSLAVGQPSLHAHTKSWTLYSHASRLARPLLSELAILVKVGASYCSDCQLRLFLMAHLMLAVAIPISCGCQYMSRVLHRLSRLSPPYQHSMLYCCANLSVLQVSIHVKGATECYECHPPASTQKTHPHLLPRNTPDKPNYCPIHCVVLQVPPPPPCQHSILLLYCCCTAVVLLRQCLCPAGVSSHQGVYRVL